MKRTVRMAHHGDPVLDQKGKVIGKVTSCAIDQEGFLTGQAIIDNKYVTEGSVLYIYQSAPDKPSPPPPNSPGVIRFLCPLRQR